MQTYEKLVWLACHSFGCMIMNRFVLLFVDLVIVAAATLFALLLRENFTLTAELFYGILPYLAITVVVAAPVLMVFGLNRGIWRLSATPDYSRVIMAVTVIVLVSVVVGFAFNRHAGVPRSLPFMQAIIMAFAMIGIRAMIRARHSWRRRNKATATTLPAIHGQQEDVLVIGINRITDLYLQSVAEFGAGRIGVAGLLGRSDKHKGRLVQQHNVLGTPEDVIKVLQDLELHGVFVAQIVLTTAFSKLSAEARSALLELDKSTNIRLYFFAELLGLDSDPGAEAKRQMPKAAERLQDGYEDEHSDGGVGTGDNTLKIESRPAASGAAKQQPDGDVAFVIAPEQMAAMSVRPFWQLKRFLDAVIAAALIILLSPLLLVVALLVAIDLGLPVVFWQQRPGLGGRPFRLYKMRSMAASHDEQGRRVPDELRSSFIGRLLRRTRLDELPQLWNIFIGDMSFVGPRPLLSVDQPCEYAARLFVRPGLTGWAQVQGGRKVSADNKAALDVWYLCNASVLLDLQIIARTIPMLFWGEQENEQAVREAWRELQEAGICSLRRP